MDLIGGYSDDSDDDCTTEETFKSESNAENNKVPRPFLQSRTSDVQDQNLTLTLNDCSEPAPEKSETNQISKVVGDTVQLGAITSSSHAESSATSEAVPERESNTSSTEIDYLGLASANDSSDDDEYNKRAKIQRMSTVNAKPNSKANDSLGHPQSNWSKFWNGEDEAIDWADEQTIWRDSTSGGVDCAIQHHSNVRKPSNPSNQKREGVISEQITSYIPKRNMPLVPFVAKQSSAATHPTPNHTANNPQTNMKLSKSCFFVHHKIAPHLHNPPHNTIPRRPLRTLATNCNPSRLQWGIGNYSHLLLAASLQNCVYIWDVFSSVDPIVQIVKHHNKGVRDARWSASGTQILSCGYDRKCCLMDVETGASIVQYQHENAVTCISYHPVVSSVFVAGSTNQLKAWDTRMAPVSGKAIRTYQYKDKFGQVQDVTFLHDGREFYTCNDLVTRDSSDRNIMAWDFNKGVVVSNQIYQERYTCCRLRVHPQEPSVLAQSQGGYVALFSTIRPYKMNKCKRFDAHQVESYSMGFDVSPDGRYLISGCTSGAVPVYDYRTSKVVRRLPINNNDVCHDVVWHPVIPSTCAMATYNKGMVTVWS